MPPKGKKVKKPVPIHLTPREEETLQAVCDGLSNREIAEKFEISVRTVEVHRYNFMKKFEVKNVAQLMNKALQMGLIGVPHGTSKQNKSRRGVQTVPKVPKSVPKKLPEPGSAMPSL